MRKTKLAKAKRPSALLKTKGRIAEIIDYDTYDTASFVNPKQQLRFEDIGLKLSETPPTQVVSIRLPSALLNELRALGSQQDVPYQALIKIFLAEAVAEQRRKRAA